MARPVRPEFLSLLHVDLACAGFSAVEHLAKMDRITPHFLVRFCAKPKRFGFYSTIYQSGPSGRVNGSVLNERLGQVDSQPVFMTPTVAS